MGTYEESGIGLAICGEEEDYISFVIGDGEDNYNDCRYRSVGASDLIKKASGIVGYDNSIPFAFDAPAWGDHQEFIAQWREETGLKWPRLCHIKITVEAEPLTAEETERIWLARQAYWKLRMEGIPEGNQMENQR